MNEYTGRKFTGERALFYQDGLRLTDCVFEDGESPLKHGTDIAAVGSAFKWKYPLWYCNNVDVRGCVFDENARAGVWYTNDISVTDTEYIAPKGFRRCENVTIENVSFPNALETFWQCRGVRIKNVSAAGDYFGMNCSDMTIDGLELNGNYGFDGAENIRISNSRLITKDAFWNSRNITAVNCFISGEYLAWNSENITLIGCTIESLQGLCYIKDLVIKDCLFNETTLAFEYSTVDADIRGSIDSVKNPSGGRITADGIGELIMEPDRVDVNATVITINGGN